MAVVPVPRLLAAAEPAGPDAEPSRPALLLVGDVDFGEPPAGGGPAAPALPGVRNAFRRLPATADEIAAVRDRFGQAFPAAPAEILSRSGATKAAFREEAPRHPWLHVATHGFFAPPGLRSVLGPAPGAGDFFGRQGIAGFHPGLLWGLVLAGANQPQGPDAESPILTALEVAELDLSHVRLAVLSACETGLGESAGGEGLLGLQRAFQTAGAQCTVASLWRVDDVATSLLMEEFYTNLWQRQMPRLQALRQAQLAVLEHPERVQDRRRRLQQALARRGLGTEAETVTAAPEADRRRSPPAWWAAFVLAGDPR